MFRHGLVMGLAARIYLWSDQAGDWVRISRHFMQEISDLKLPHLSMEEPWFAADPFPQFDEARSEHPWLARCGASRASAVFLIFGVL